MKENYELSVSNPESVMLVKEINVKYKFIRRLLAISTNIKLTDIVSWSKDGKAFEIKDIKGFVEEVLPKYYKHNNLSNFIRQLNMYSFKKIKDPLDKDNVKLIYFNPLFIRDHPELINKIDRQKLKGTKEIDKDKNPLGSTITSQLTHNHSGQESSISINFDKLDDLKSKVLSLEKQINLIDSKNMGLSEKISLSSAMIEDSNSYIQKLEKSLLLLYSILKKQKALEDTKSNSQLSKINKQISSFKNRARFDQDEILQTNKKLNNLGRSDIQKFLSVKRNYDSSNCKELESIKSNSSQKIPEFVDKLLNIIEPDQNLAYLLYENSLEANFTQCTDINSFIGLNLINDQPDQRFGNFHQESFNDVRNAFSKVHDSYFD